MRWFICACLLAGFLCINVALASKRPVLEDDMMSGLFSHCDEEVPQRLSATRGHKHNLWELMQKKKEYSYFRCAVKRLGLQELFENDKDNLTVFVPENDAIKRLPHDVLRHFMRPEHKEDVIGVIHYHIVEKNFDTDEFEDGEDEESKLGKEVGFHVREIGEEKLYFVNQALLVDPDNEASNGILHGVDAVLLPDHFSVNRSYEHFKDKTIGEVLSKLHVFSSLWRAIKKVKLDKVLNDEKQQLTFFAPPDYVWSRGPFKDLLKEDNEEELFAALKYHIAKEIVFSTTLADGDEVKTAQGNSLEVHRSQVLDGGPDSVSVDYALLKRRDYAFINGVVHILDRPLIPKA